MTKHRVRSFPFACAGAVLISFLTANIVGTAIDNGWAHGFPFSFEQRPNLTSLTNGVVADSLTSGRGMPILDVNGALSIPSRWLFDAPLPRSWHTEWIAINLFVGIGLVIGAYAKAKRSHAGKTALRIVDLAIATAFMATVAAFWPTLIEHAGLLYVLSLVVLTAAFLATISIISQCFFESRKNSIYKKP